MLEGYITIHLAQRKLLTSCLLLAALLLGTLAVHPMNSAFAQRQKSFNILAFGDSVMWGQGLLGQDKYHRLVENFIKAKYPGIQINKQVFAHSGAAIGKDI